jgi:beta-xylosidase
MEQPINPFLRGFNADPSIVRVGDDYFLATSTFEFFPGVAIHHSRDLVNWKLIGHALNKRSQLDMRTVEPSAGIWAPTLRYHDGYFYLTTCKFDRYRPQCNERIFPRGFYVKTNDIFDDSKWSDPVYYDNVGFDQDLFWDDDGRVYLSATQKIAGTNPNEKHFGVHISQIDLSTGRSITKPLNIRRSPSGVAEGSHILKRNGFYYLFIAEGGTDSGHHEVVYRSNNVFGPYEPNPQNPLIGHVDGRPVHSTGHADLVETRGGQWYAVLLGVRSNNKAPSPMGRESFIVPVTWENDWPIFVSERALGVLAMPPTKKWTADLSKGECHTDTFLNDLPNSRVS